MSKVNGYNNDEHVRNRGDEDDDADVVKRKL